MIAGKTVEDFLSQYDEQIYNRAYQLRNVLLVSLPGIIEQLDTPARMVGYCYGQKYAEMICTIIPSKKGLKLGFYKGNELPDPDNLLEGSGKISRYVEIKTEEQINSAALKKLLSDALTAYKQRMRLLAKK